jgi:U6 snRNA-associated Sm-like protein LSm8
VCASSLTPSRRAQSGVEQVPLGLYLVRGDNVAVVGELDEDLDANLDLSSIRAPPLRTIQN